MCKVVVLLHKSNLLPFCRSRFLSRRRCLRSVIVGEETAMNYVAGENKHLWRDLKESSIKLLVSFKKMQTDRLCYKTVSSQKLRFN